MVRAIAIAIITAACISTGMFAAAQDCLPPDAVDPWLATIAPGDWTTLPVVVGDVGYCVSDSRIVVLDLSDPRAPAIVDTVGIQAGEAYGAVAGGEYVLIPTRDPTGVEIYRTLDQGAVEFLGRAELEDYTSQVAVSGHALYAASGGGLLVFDISDPGAPVLHQQMNPEVSYRLHGPHGGVLYLAHGQVLETFDLTDPLQPQSVTAIDDIGPLRMFFGASRGFGIDWMGRVRVYDLTDPLVPVVQGACVYPTADIADLDLIDGWLVAHRRYTLHLFDVSDPANPHHHCNVDHIPDGNGVMAIGPTLYFQGDDGALHVYDGDLPLTPVTSRFELDGFTSRFAVHGDHAYFNSEDELFTLDISDPDHPVEVSRIPLAGGRNVFAFHGDVAYCGATDNRFHVLDLTDPSTPVHSGTVTLTTGWSTDDLEVANHFLCVVGYYNTLTIYDIVDPLTPVRTFFSGGTDSCYFVKSLGRFLYLRWNDDEGIRVMEIDDTGYPHLIKVTDIPSMGVTGIWGDLMVSSGGSNGYIAFVLSDVSNPADPVILSEFMGWTGKAEFDGRYLYWVEDHVAHAADFFDLSQPRYLGQIAIPGWVRDVGIRGDRVFWQSGMTDFITGLPVCGGVVALDVAGFEVVDRGSWHEIAWTLIGAPSPDSLRLTCRQRGVETTLGFEGLGGGAFRARHARIDRGVEAVYTLYAGHDDRARILATQALAPRVAAARAVLDAHPNPANPGVRLRITIPFTGRWRLSVFDVRGRRIARLSDGVMEAGSHEFTWMGRDGRGRDLPSGTYVLQLRSDEQVVSRKLSLVR